MSYSYSFVPNNVYGADALNEITKRLVTSGVEDSFENGVPYNFGHINTISKNISTMGVIPENNSSLKVTNNGKVGDEYTITIADGTAFFEDGSTITIYDGGETLPYTYGQKNYVYVVRDLNLNKNMPKVTLTEPEGDFVPLAEISETGVVTDTRTFAVGKLPGYMSDYNNSKNIVADIIDGKMEIDLGGDNYSLLLVNIYYEGVTKFTDAPLCSLLIVNGKLMYSVALSGSECYRNFDLSLFVVNWSTSSSYPSVHGALTLDGSKLNITLDKQKNYAVNIYAA